MILPFWSWYLSDTTHVRSHTKFQLIWAINTAFTRGVHMGHNVPPPLSQMWSWDPLSIRVELLPCVQLSIAPSMLILHRPATDQTPVHAYLLQEFGNFFTQISTYCTILYSIQQQLNSVRSVVQLLCVSAAHPWAGSARVSGRV